STTPRAAQSVALPRLRMYLWVPRTGKRRLCKRMDGAALGRVLIVLHHLRYRYQFKSFRLIASDQVIGGDHGLGAVCAHLLVAAVVKQDHAAAAHLIGDLALD